MKPKVSRKKEETKIRAQINEIKTEKTIKKINETKNWFLENINTIDKLLARFSKRKRERTQIRNKRGDITADTTDIQRIVKGYYDHLYANKVDNLEKIGKFLERCNLIRLSHEETKNLNRPIASMEIESVIKNVST